MGIKAKPTFSLKDQFFNKESVAELSTALVGVTDDFKGSAYQKEVLERFPLLELKERVRWMVTTLRRYLPDDFVEASSILSRALPEPLDPTLGDDDFGGFIWVVPGEFVAEYGCSEPHLTRSLEFLREATKRFSSESAIRPFLHDFPSETLAFLRQCATDENYHVRRLASEGSRPFLPWAQRVPLPLEDIVNVLDQLHADGTRYVTRSVANSLNDISKIDADRVIATLGRWNACNRQSSKELSWMTRHALRTLLKWDHPEALGLLGYTTRPRFSLSDLQTSERVKVGDAFHWVCTLESQSVQQLKITMRIHFLKANGKHSAKVFSVKEGQFEKGELIRIRKLQSFKPITTRTLYPGTHYAELVVNGVTRETRQFDLVE